jgi:hypothetical protein
MNPFVVQAPKPGVAGLLIKGWLIVAGLAIPSGLVAGMFFASMFWGCSYTRRAILPDLPEITITTTTTPKNAKQSK